MRWNCMSKALRLAQITVEHQDCPFFTVFLTIKTSSQNISKTLLQISLKLHEHRGGYWRKKLLWMILEEQFPVPIYTAVSKIGNSVISLLRQLRCHCNPDHNNFSSLSSTTVVAIFSKLCLWRRSLCSNLGGIGPGKLYRATLSSYISSFLYRLWKYYTNLCMDGISNNTHVPSLWLLPYISQMLYPVAYTVVIPLNSGITMHVASVTFNSSWKNRPNTITIPGNSVNINIDCLASSDRLEYNWLPTIIIWIISSTEVIILLILL